MSEDVVSEDRAAEPTERPAEPVAIVFRRRVRPGHESEYEAWLEGMQKDTRGMPGYLGVEVVRPAAGGREYVSLLRFASVEALARWETSDLRSAWLARLPADAVEGDAEVRRVEGMEAWFTAGTPTAPKWKMALVLVTVVYGLILLLSPIVTAIVGEETPLDLRLFVSVCIEVTLMTWLVMPALTRVLGGWLFAK